MINDYNLLSSKEILNLVRKDVNNLLYINHIPDEVQIYLIENGMSEYLFGELSDISKKAIQIKNKNFDLTKINELEKSLILMLLKKDGNNIKYIKNPSANYKSVAINSNPYSFVHFMDTITPTMVFDVVDKLNSHVYEEHLDFFQNYIKNNKNYFMSRVKKFKSSISQNRTIRRILESIVLCEPELHDIFLNRHYVYTNIKINKNIKVDKDALTKVLLECDYDISNKINIEDFYSIDELKDLIKQNVYLIHLFDDEFTEEEQLEIFNKLPQILLNSKSSKHINKISKDYIFEVFKSYDFKHPKTYIGLPFILNDHREAQLYMAKQGVVLSSYIIENGTVSSVTTPEVFLYLYNSIFLMNPIYVNNFLTDEYIIQIYEKVTDVKSAKIIFGKTKLDNVKVYLQLKFGSNI